MDLDFFLIYLFELKVALPVLTLRVVIVVIVTVNSTFDFATFKFIINQGDSYHFFRTTKYFLYFHVQWISLNWTRTFR